MAAALPIEAVAEDIRPMHHHVDGGWRRHEYLVLGETKEASR